MILYMFRDYTLIIRRLNCIHTTSGIVILEISEWSKITSVLVFIRNAANYTLVILGHSLIFRVTIPNAASIQFSLLMMSI